MKNKARLLAELAADYLIKNRAVVKGVTKNQLVRMILEAQTSDVGGAKVLARQLVKEAQDKREIGSTMQFTRKNFKE